MKKKDSKFRQKIKMAIEDMVEGRTEGQEIKIKFYENGTDKFLIEKTIDSFTSEILKIIEPNEEQ